MKKIIFLINLIFIFTSCSGLKSKVGSNTEGIASWYGDKYHGRRTASGEKYDMRKYTAAHKELPFGTIVQITNLENKKSVNVRINDRGPFIKGREIDLSKKSFETIAPISKGVIPVKIKVIEIPN